MSAANKHLYPGYRSLPFFLLALFMLVESAPACKAGAAQKAGIGQSAQDKPAINKIQAKSTKSASKHVFPRRGLVPPPPPEMPILGGDFRQSLALGMPVDYMSKPDLTRLKKRLEKEIDKLKSDNQESQDALKEADQKLKEFESFYKEGVISRRELEQKQRELKDIQNSGGDLEERLQDSQNDLDKVNKQLNVLEKRQSAGVKKAVRDKSVKTEKNKR